MGGFTSYNIRHGTFGVILPPHAEDWYNTAPLRIHQPEVRNAITYFTKDEIKDKSKSSVISKVIVVGQTAWFLVQCIVRHVQGLEVTQLELITIAFVALNFITAALWWDKPADVDYSISVVSDSTHRTTQGHSYRTRKSSGNVFSRSEQYVTDIAESMNPFIRIWFWMAVSIFNLIIYPAFALTKLGLNIIADFRPAFDGDKCVPTFYSHTRTRTKQDIPKGMILSLGFVGVVFGGIHLAAWSADFPTTKERWIWRGSALTITILPIVFLLFLLWFGGVIDLSEESTSVGWASIFVVMPLLYTCSLLVLLVQACIALRSLPLSAYQTVKWTTLIPHI